MAALSMRSSGSVKKLVKSACAPHNVCSNIAQQCGGVALQHPNARNKRIDHAMIGPAAAVHGGMHGLSQRFAWFEPKWLRNERQAQA